MQNGEKVIIKNQLEMLKLASDFAKTLKGGDIVSLKGEMGVGKTFFAKGVCEALGVLQQVTSPTFAIMNEYKGKAMKVYHYDFYRIIDESEAEELGLIEMFGDYDAVCLIEWASKVQSYIPPNVKTVFISKLSETSREVTFL